jgi:hypothetical protein
VMVAAHECADLVGCHAAVTAVSAFQSTEC